MGIPKSTYAYTLDSIGTGVRYQSFVFSQLNDGSESDSVGTVVFAGVFYRTDGTIDEYQIGDQTAILSGYGWDIQTGIGENLPYLAEYSDLIDMHLRAYLTGELLFYSPTLFTPGTRSTYFSLVGSGQEAFDLTNLDEPTFTSVNVALDNVYLLKTQEGYYIKIWIREIDYINYVVPYYNVLFDYKVQPIAGLRVL